MINTTATIAIVLWLIGFAVAMIIKRSPEALCGWMLGGWLFLPQISVDLPVLNLNKLSLVTMATGVASIVIDRSRCAVFRFSAIDLPVLGLCSAVFASSISNGKGAYDGFATSINYFVVWGIPWFVGRIVFASPRNAILLARYTIVAALIYLPFCLYEIKMSPLLHAQVYGYSHRGGNLRLEGMRFGLWRPRVFMETGLAVSLFMGSASVLAGWAARTAALKKIGGMSVWSVAAILGVATILCVSSGAILLILIGWAIVLTERLSMSRRLLFLLATIPFLYPVYRMVDMGGMDLEVTAKNADLAARQASLRTRIRSENLYLQKWRGRPLLGSTAWYYHQVGNSGDAIPDSLWIVILAKYGLVGWGSLTLCLAGPVFLFLRKLAGPLCTSHVEFVLGLCVVMFLLDCLLNSMINPMYVVMAATITHVRPGSISNEQRLETNWDVSPARPSRRPWPISTGFRQFRVA